MNAPAKKNYTSQVDATFPIRQGVDPNYLASVLTKDVTTMESILELVDNAVDAARDSLLEKKNTELDKYGLPSRYDGSQINIRFGKGSITFIDNCAGISEETLAGRAFVIGAMSHHDYGIGRFGIGLKRALFRLGKKYVLRTDTGAFSAKMRFNSTHLGGADSTLNAIRCRTTGKAMTLVRISDLRDGVKHEFSANSWIDNLSTMLSRRYGIYVEKGFKILINDRPIIGFGPKIRNPSPVEDQTDNFTVTGNVRVFIDAGMHEDYRFEYEDDHSRSTARRLTDQYGWYFVCNDRIVEVAKHERALGWTTSWHQEYYGFIGWVRFISQDAEDLPWDTKKSVIDPHSTVFRAVSGHLQEFAEKYKTRNKLLRKHQGNLPGTVEGNNVASSNSMASNTSDASNINQPSTTKGSSEQSKSNSTATNSNNFNKPKPNDHNENWHALLPPLNTTIKHQKVKALIYEASILELKNCYAGSMLFRSIIELALFENLKATKSFRSVRQMVFDQAKKDDREFTEEQQKGFRPTFSQVLEWLNKNDDYFPEEVRRECITARNKFGKHLKELNGIVHEGDLTNSSKLVIVRDDTMPLLNFLLLGI